MTASERISTIAEGQGRNRGLGNMRGSSPRPMTSERLANDEREFQAWYDRASQDEIMDMMGR
jgi:hypothetical protein